MNKYQIHITTLEKQNMNLINETQRLQTINKE